MPRNSHQPVLLNEVVRFLKPKVGESYLDATAGYGGHAQAILKRTKSPLSVTLVDRDQEAAAVLKDRFGPGVEIIHQDFLGASSQLVEQDRQFDMILADLGLSSPHLNEAKRGFAISKPGPLDMRMDSSQDLTAEQIVNSYSEAELMQLLRQYGEEPKARSIARRIIAARPLQTTAQLAATVARAWPGRSRAHPATRTFQALRIAVNNELAQLEQSLPVWVDLLAPGGRLVVISFHSLEDRLVKQFFAAETASTYDARLKLLTKKPLSASADEIASNPRARSAKLRAVVKNKNKQKG